MKSTIVRIMVIGLFAFLTGCCATGWKMPGQPAEFPGPPPPPPPNPEQTRIITEMNQRLTTVQANAADERRVYEARLQQLESLMVERDKSLEQAEKEVQLATEEVTRARNEMQQWKQDMGRLREQLRAAEKDNVTTLKAMVEMMEKLADKARIPGEGH